MRMKILHAKSGGGFDGISGGGIDFQIFTPTFQIFGSKSQLIIVQQSRNNDRYFRRFWRKKIVSSRKVFFSQIAPVISSTFLAFLTDNQQCFDTKNSKVKVLL